MRLTAQLEILRLQAVASAATQLNGLCRLLLVCVRMRARVPDFSKRFRFERFEGPPCLGAQRVLDVVGLTGRHTSPASTNHHFSPVALTATKRGRQLSEDGSATTAV